MRERQHTPHPQDFGDRVSCAPQQPPAILSFLACGTQLSMVSCPCLVKTASFLGLTHRTVQLAYDKMSDRGLCGSFLVSLKNAMTFSTLNESNIRKQRMCQLFDVPREVSGQFPSGMSRTRRWRGCFMCVIVILILFLRCVCLECQKDFTESKLPP